MNGRRHPTIKVGYVVASAEQPRDGSSHPPLSLGAFFAAADVGIDKLLEEARENALAESADTLRKKTQEMMEPLKKALLPI